MTTNPLRVWLTSSGKITETNENCTHFMMDGGKINLSEHYEIFQEMYVKYIEHKHSIVERRTPIFKMFIDFDVLSEKECCISEYVICIQECIKNIYGNDYICIITGNDNHKNVKRNDKVFIKQGYHLHWPNILVDQGTALKIRKCIVIRLNTCFGKVSHFNDSWEKIIDKCVYEQNGLRILGSDKCSFSDGIRNYENRIKIIKFVFNGKKSDESLTEMYKADTLKAVKDTSIRTDSELITEYINLPEYEEEIEEDSVDKGGFDVIKKESKEYLAIEKFFRNYVVGYKFQDIRKILKAKESALYILESKSKYCQNIEDFHSNNHIFFKLTPSGFCQKCRSDRQGIICCCRDYSSNFIPITPTLLSILSWKKPKTKEVDIPRNYSLDSLLERMENRIIGKPQFNGPTNQAKKKNKLKK